MSLPYLFCAALKSFCSEIYNLQLFFKKLKNKSGTKAVILLIIVYYVMVITQLDKGAQHAVCFVL